MAKDKAVPPGPPKGAPSADVQAQFERLHEEVTALNEVAESATAAYQTKFEELMTFAKTNGITDDPEGEEV